MPSKYRPWLMPCSQGCRPSEFRPTPRMMTVRSDGKFQVVCTDCWQEGLADSDPVKAASLWNEPYILANFEGEAKNKIAKGVNEYNEDACSHPRFIKASNVFKRKRRIA